MKEFNFFIFLSSKPESFITHRLTFKSNRTTTGKIETSGFEKITKLATFKRLEPKKAPKYSKSVGVVNSVLTDSDKAYLEKRATTWGLHYNK